MRPRQLPKRKRLIVRNFGIASALLVLTLAGYFLLRPEPEPYRAGESVAGIVDSLGRDVPPEAPRITFRDVTAEVGIRFRHFGGVRSTQLPEDMGSGAAWGDYDGDGDLDLFLCNIAGPLTADSEEIRNSSARNTLYRNDSGVFVDVSESAGVDFRGLSMGAAFADYDGDGDLDLFVTNYGENLLYQNQGDGRFREVSRDLGIGGVEGFWTGAAWGDYDRDGDLDLYVCGYVRYSYDPADVGKSTRQYSGVVPYTLNPSSYPAERNLLYRNEGGTRFVEVGQSLQVDNPKGRSLAAAWVDFDLDGWLDLYVANDISDNVMFRNLGGKFEDVSYNALVADYRGAMGLAIGDWDNDRDQDIFVTHWLAQENALLTNMVFAFDNVGGEPSRLMFMDLADQLGLGQIALDFVGWGTAFLDYDNDGRLDLYVANGSTFQVPDDPQRLIPMRDLLFWNKNEEDGFFEVGAISGEPFRLEKVGRGAAVADYDGDGDLDVVVVNHSDQAQLLRNEGPPDRHWLKVRLEGGAKNRFGLGALIEVEASGRVQFRQVGAQASYLSQNPAEEHFGLGSAPQAERVTVRFLGGQTVVQEKVAADQSIVIKAP